MELSKISKYFTVKTLEEIIQKVGGSKLSSYKLVSGFDTKGDAYLSEVFRLKLFGINNDKTKDTFELDVIVKAMITNPYRRKLFRSPDFFRNEINFYTKVLPIFEKFQKDKNINDPFIEYPKYLASHCDGENDFIALQDVTNLGFLAPDRKLCVDLEHCQLIMRTLGRFHGLSLALKDQCPELFDKCVNSIEEVYYAEKFRKWYEPFIKDAKLVANDAVSKEYPGTIYEEKTKNFLSDQLYDTLIHLVKPSNKYTVIGHGDCWRPNFLMKYEKIKSTSSKLIEIPKEVLMIDYQLVRCASPVLDITFFLYSCTDSKLRDEHYETILKAYYDGASKLIKDLGSNPNEIFTFETLKSELKEFGKFGCAMGIESLPLALLDDDEIEDFNVLNKEDAVLTDVWKIKPIENVENRKRIADCFKHAIDCGYIV